MRLEFNTVFTMLGTVVLFLFGGWTIALTVLMFAMIADFITGLLAAWKGKSKKTKKGHLSSSVCFWGLLKKMLILAAIAFSYKMDSLVHSNGLLYNMVILFYVSNESISFLENLVLLEVKIPAKLKAVIEELGENNDDL